MSDTTSVPASRATSDGRIGRLVGRVVPVPPSPLEALVDRRRGTVPRGSHRALALCEALGSPHVRVPAIHVAGTNGKTSVVRMVATLLAALDVRVGDTTSPHLHDLAERIRLDGRPATRAQLMAATGDLAAALADAQRRTGEPPTFFDAVTAVALRVFADTDRELAVVEAGIGGSGDATDVVRAMVSVLTPIGLDHPQLGTTHAEVAANKAGIVRPDRTVLTAAQHPEAARVIARVAASQGAQLLRAGTEFGVVRRRTLDDGQAVELAGLRNTRLRVALPLHGASQADNAALALAAVQAALGTVDLDPERLRAGFSAVRVPGRTEILHPAGGPTMVLDGAHDPQAGAALAATLDERYLGVPCAVVVGTTGGRDPRPLLAPLRDRTVAVVAVAASAPSSTPPDAIVARLSDGGWPAVAACNVTDALTAAAERVGPDGVVVVTGSLYLVAEARSTLRWGAEGPPARTGRVAV